MTTGQKIKAYRKSLGLTQETLGAAIGVGKATINKYETGIVVNLKRSTLYALSQALHVLPSDLLDDSPVESPASDDVRQLLRLLNQLGPDQIRQVKNVVLAMFPNLQ